MSWRLTTLLLVLFALNGCENSDINVSSQAGDGGVQRQIKYGFTVTNPSNKIEKNVLVSVLAPLSEGGVQRLANIKATMPFDAVSNKNNMKELHFRIDELQPYGVKDVWITAMVSLSQKRAESEVDNVKKYLVSSPFVETDDARIRSKLSELRVENEMGSLKNIYAWIVDNIKDEGYVKEDKGAVYALTEGKGDCTEQMYLFVALSRALGVPARGVAGFVQSHDGVVYSRDYHNWAEVLVDGAWRVVDPQKEKFLVEEEGYIAMAYLEAGEYGAQSFFRVHGDALVEFK